MRSVVLLTLVAAVAAVPANPRRRVHVKPVQLPLQQHHEGADTARNLEAFVPVEPVELSEATGLASRPVRDSGFVQELPNFGAGAPLPDAPRNGDAGFFEIPAGFPSIGSLGGFGDSFERSDAEVNNIEVIPIQFPQSNFQARLDEDGDKTSYRVSPDRS